MKKSYRFGPVSRASFLWLIASVLCFFFLNPFELPVWEDQTYFLYMSQTIFRGQDLYESVNYGYTPLASLIGGGFMRLFSVFGLPIDTIETFRLLGITLYCCVVVSFFRFSFQFFRQLREANLATLIFLSLTWLQVLSSSSLEPKILGLLFELWAFSCILKKKWLLAGLFFALASLCWHPLIINGLVLLCIILWQKEQNKIRATLQGILGGGIGLSPIFIYLYLTNDWNFFWNQAILRKINVEGSALFDEPFRWLIRGIEHRFLNEVLFFFIAAIAGVYLIIQFIRNRNFTLLCSRVNLEISSIGLLFFTTLIWSIWNSMEFQGPPDLIVLLPSIIILATFFISRMILQRLQSHWSLVACVLLFVYGFADLLVYPDKPNYSQQRAWISELYDKYGDLFPINFEESYVLNEKEMPTKYMRFGSYEDFLIEGITPGGCDAVISHFEEKKYKVIIAGIKPEGMNAIGICAEKIISEFSNLETYDSIGIEVPRKSFFQVRTPKRRYKIFKTRFLEEDKTDSQDGAKPPFTSF